MKCPNCGFTQAPGRTDCKNCGTLVEKFEEVRATGRHAQFQEKPDLKKYALPAGIGVIALLLLVLIGTAAGGNRSAQVSVLAPYDENADKMAAASKVVEGEEEVEEAPQPKKSKAFSSLKKQSQNTIDPACAQSIYEMGGSEEDVEAGCTGHRHHAD